MRERTTYTLREQNIVPLCLSLLDNLLYDGYNRIFDNEISNKRDNNDNQHDQQSNTPRKVGAIRAKVFNKPLIHCN